MIKRGLLVASILTLILASFVIAAGSSSGNAQNNNSINSSANSTITTCEDKGTLRDRIRCRFENPSVARSEAYSSIEEACRDHNRTQACEALYNRAAGCYSQSNHSAKKECFLRESGININAQGTFRAAPDENKRNYVVLLLYELQERIEESQEEGKITTDQATSLVAKIVEIKRMILSQEPRSSIIVKINEFKQEYKEVMGGIQ